MPPLRFCPEVTLATTQAELDERFRAFSAGEVEYVRGHDSKQTYHLFMPHDMDHHVPIMGLMVDGITREPVVADYFGDYSTYQRVTEGSVPHITGRETQGVSDEDRRQKVSNFIQKILRK